MVSNQKSRATVGRDSRLDESKINMLFDSCMHIFPISHAHLDRLVPNVLVLALFFNSQSSFDLIPIPPSQRIFTEVPLDEPLNILKRKPAFLADI